MNVTADDCVRELYDYLTDKLKNDGGDDVLKIYQYEDKPKSYKGAYIAINALPFVYGYALNDKCILNVNVHVPCMTDGSYYRRNGNRWLSWLMSYIPTEGAYEEDKELVLQKAAYTIDNISQPRKDIDNTHYINCHIKIRFIA